MSASLQLQPHRKPTNMDYVPRPWTEADDKNLRVCTVKNATMDQMVRALKRPEKSIRTRAIALKINLDYLNKKD